ncbi:MAG: hypothetical protein A3H93_09370 [Rhodocyclales bacterium RIFCSPLOWO2_02_FULL_63_24]|nr:MAG: hypothetical protein A2040_01315 [Rhodocyclales bacterium GWA2_65_19]OHC68814.1 MAG: hypothetical protein A3H93_09370 [Rhodocyclales bacterium RIFCSPLOWO2_02_FULL_63_24]
MRYLAVVVLISCLGPGVGNAQTIVPKLDEAGRRGEVARTAKNKAAAQFDAADKDKDGKLSREEAAKASSYVADNFDKLDADKDGFLSWEEFVGHNRWPK